MKKQVPGCNHVIILLFVVISTTHGHPIQHIQCQAISYGTVLRTEKITRNSVLYQVHAFTCFSPVWLFTCFFFSSVSRLTCFLPGVEPNWTRSSQEYLRSFGERYRDPFFSPEALFEFFTVLALSEKKSRKYSTYISTFHPKKGSILWVNRVQKWFWGKWSVFTFKKLISWRNGKRRWILPKWLNIGASQEKLTRFASFPGQTRCWNLHFQFSKRFAVRGRRADYYPLLIDL